MANVYESRPHPVIKQWKHELELLRSEIGHRHDEVIERMRENETRLLQAIYSFREANHRCLAVSTRSASSFPERLASLEDRIVQIARGINRS